MVTIVEGMQLTFACYSQQNDATGLLDITRNQTLDKSNIVIAFSFSVATDGSNETLDIQRKL